MKKSNNEETMNDELKVLEIVTERERERLRKKERKKESVIKKGIL